MSAFPALMYHAVSRVGGRLRRLGLSPEQLAAQLAALQRAGYELMGLTEALAAVTREPSRAVVAVTFDDGYRDFLHAAVPVLQALDARATVYVPTAFAGGRAHWLGARAESVPPLLTWGELGDCVSSGRVEIGSHSHTHVHLDTLGPQALEVELRHSKRLLEERLQTPVVSFCYPHGYHSRGVREAVRNAGYDNASEVGRRLRSACHRWSVSRLAVDSSHAPAAVVREVKSGGPVLVPSAKRALQPAWRLARQRGARRGSLVS
jgi:peptidoglycan/xylan/chitin deacetylase (PgdA/CDA1 family)